MTSVPERPRSGGWGGTRRSPAPFGVCKEARLHVSEIVDEAFPPRTRIEQAEGIEILRLRLEAREEQAIQSNDVG